MGEIGIDYHVFYNHLRWWEVRSIIRGYNARHHAGWEQARLVAYNAHYCMGSKDPVPTVTEWIKYPWEKDQIQPVSDEEIKEMQDEIAAINKMNEQNKTEQ